MSNIIKVDNPSSSHIRFSPEENQMFGILILGIHPTVGMNQGEKRKYFDVYSYIKEYNFETL